MRRCPGYEAKRLLDSRDSFHVPVVAINMHRLYEAQAANISTEWHPKQSSQRYLVHGEESGLPSRCGAARPGNAGGRAHSFAQSACAVRRVLSSLWPKSLVAYDTSR